MWLILLFTIAIGTLSTVLFVKKNRKAGSSSGSGRGESVNLRSEVEVAAEADSSCRSIEGLELVIENQLSNLDSSIADDQLLMYKEELRNMLKEAVKRWGHSTILRLLKLFKLLGLEREGLEVFVDYLKDIISTRSSAEVGQLYHLTEVMERTNSNIMVKNIVACLTNLSNNIVSAINRNDEILRYLGGERGIVYAICKLQKVCDLSASNIVDKFCYGEILDMDRVNGEICRIKGSEHELQEIDVYVQGMASLAHWSMDYMEKMMSEIRSLMDHQELCREASMAVSSGYLSMVSRDSSKLYVELEKMYMKKGVQKAIRIDERVQDSHVSSMVDEAFYVLWTSCERAISLSRSTYVQKVCRHAVYILKREYTDAVKPCFHVQTRTEFVRALNNCEGSIKNALKLKRRIEEQCKEAFYAAQLDMVLFECCIDDLDDVSRRFRKYLNDGIYELKYAAESEIESILKSVETTGSDGEAVYVESNSWLQRLMDALDVNVECLKPEMSATNYESFVHPVVQLIVRWLPDNPALYLSKCRHEKMREMIELASHLSGMIPGMSTEDIPNIGVEQVMATVKYKIKLIVERVKLNMSAYDEDNPWVEKLIDEVVINVTWLEPLMTATNYDTFVYSVIVFIVTWLRDSIIVLRSNEGRHEQLLRDISKLASHLSIMTWRSTDELLDVLMEKLAATVTPRIGPYVETISSKSPCWFQRLIDALDTNVAWLKPLMKASHYDTFTYVVIDVIVTRLDWIIISVEFSEGEQVQLRSDMEKLAAHVSSMCGRPMESQLSTLKHLARYEPPLMWRCPT